MVRMRAPNMFVTTVHFRPQRPRSFWSAPRIATSSLVQHRKSAIHGLPVTLRLLRVKSDKSDWFWSQSIVFSKPFKTRMSLDLARGRDSLCWPKGARPLGTRITTVQTNKTSPIKHENKLLSNKTKHDQTAPKKVAKRWNVWSPNNVWWCLMVFWWTFPV